MVTNIARSLRPPLIWNALRSIIRNPPPSSPAKIIDYQGVSTLHDVSMMHEGRFGEIQKKYTSLNPFTHQNTTCIRYYLLCMLASISKNIEGDYVTAGVSYGVAPRIIYDFVGFEDLGKKLYLIDPFEGVDRTGNVNKKYNLDLASVRNQYPEDAPVIIHKGYIPSCLESLGIGCLAFVHLNTGCEEPEAESLPFFYRKLSPGGIIVIDAYCLDKGNAQIYDPVIKSLGAEVFGMVTGQGVIIKPVT